MTSGRKAKKLRKLAKFKANEKADYLELTSAKKKVLQINRDNSTEEVILDRKQVIRDDSKRIYKNLKNLYKRLKQGE